MKAKRLWENVIHGWFLLMGLVTVGCVLLITVYLVISGIPAIREIGLIKFLFGTVWDSNGSAAAIRHPALYPDQHLRHGGRHRCWASPSAS